MRLSTTIFLPLLLTACVPPDAGEDRCLEDRSALAYDALGPWDTSPRDAFAHTLGERTGTLTWLGGGELGQLIPDTGESSFTFAIVHDEASAESIDRTHEGTGRLACIDSLSLRAQLTLATDDGVLQEQVEIVLTLDQGTLGNTVLGEVDLSNHAFAGSLTWTPASGEGGQLFLRMSFTADTDASARGWLIYADPAQTTIEGNVVELSGQGAVLAEWIADPLSP
ncbi:MAG: hypothetical protein HC927_12695 [Deltaproteobacteria bacterium]|nr:hypothetical protein [Deltaproteobacteria bacterium]